MKKAVSQTSKSFKLNSIYNPAGDQGTVIKEITQSLEKGNREQTILGVTGSGKTYMMAKIIEKLQKPTLIIAHNKTLAAQLAEEFKRFFPENAVHYFVSYYDYYQPESYIPRSDTYIEKQTQINEEIDRLRNATTQALLTRKDVLIVASVSCIYGIGNPEDFDALKLDMAIGSEYKLDKIIRRLIDMQFIRTNMDLRRGVFRLLGDTLELVPSGEENGYRFLFEGDELTNIQRFDTITRDTLEEISNYTIFPAKQYVTTKEKISNALGNISADMDKQVDFFNSEGKLLQAQRIKERTENDLEMLKNLGFVGGIENYSIYFDGRNDGEPPTTLIDYFDKNSLTFIDESHITIPQIGAMYGGDHSRKVNLVDYGFRLPSAMNNRPLRREEFYNKINQVVYVSATPGDYEIENSSVISKAIIRPTGLLDPQIILKPVKNQVDDVLEQIRVCVSKGQRVLITTLTKKFAQELDIFFKELSIKSAYIHSDVETLDRLDILSDLRRGKYDVLIGINLLREGLDLPEVSLVAIFDADKEGFLRSHRSLIQIIGRAARHEKGRVIMYADTITDSMKKAITETENRRELQQKFNEKNRITPKSTSRELKNIADDVREQIDKDEDWGKSGITYSSTGGFEENKEIDFEIDSRFKREKTKSIHGKSNTNRFKAKQTYQDFDAIKATNILELEKLKLPISELQERLQIAIDAMDFEMAAAIRDILENKTL
jgi:excinuclease ABC subunit B